MIFYNGSTGSLGRYFGEVADEMGTTSLPVRARIEDTEVLRSELEAVSPPRATFLHFAAKVSVPWCEAHPEETMQTNVADTLELTRVFLDHCDRHELPAQVMYVSSAHIYARNDGKISELDAASPRSVYARSKLEAEGKLIELCRSRGVDLRIARVFGLVAPGQPENYILPGLLKRAREKRVTGVPGLNGVRDYLDSRDVCRALVRIHELPGSRFKEICPNFILNVGSGEGIRIGDALAACVKAIYPRAEAEKLIGEMTEAPARPDDVPRIVASIERYLTLFGESPKRISLETTIRDSLKNA
jgi:nucleoside-diphosphate-sugar epimerase